MVRRDFASIVDGVLPFALAAAGLFHARPDVSMLVWDALMKTRLSDGR